MFSEPPMGQSDALSYIVAGKPMDQIGSGSGERRCLAIGNAVVRRGSGWLLAKNVGRRPGDG